MIKFHVEASLNMLWVVSLCEEEPWKCMQVNNAGVNFNLGSANSVEFAEKVVATNYFGTKRMIQAMIPLMRLSTSGARIVNVTSRLGRLNGRRNVSTTLMLYLYLFSYHLYFLTFFISYCSLPWEITYATTSHLVIKTMWKRSWYHSLACDVGQTSEQGCWNFFISKFATLVFLEDMANFVFRCFKGSVDYILVILGLYKLGRVLGVKLFLGWSKGYKYSFNVILISSDSLIHSISNFHSFSYFPCGSYFCSRF